MSYHHRNDCDICRGGGVIRLPVRPRLSVAALEWSNSETIASPYREFPCPECASQVTEDRVRLVEAHAQIDARCPDQEKMKEIARRDVAHQIALELLASGLIWFREYSSPSHVGHEILDRAKRSILNWGSHYTSGAGPISKDEAVRAIGTALREAEEQHRGSMRPGS